MKRISGFSLIELMIVIAIIGILATISIPLYLNYTARAQATESITLLDGLKVPFLESLSQDGIQSACDSKIVTSPKGKYLDSITIKKVDDTTCQFIAKFKKGEGISDKIGGENVVFTYNTSSTNSEWKCTSTLDDAVRPKSCDKA